MPSPSSSPDAPARRESSHHRRRAGRGVVAGRQPRVAFRFTLTGDRISTIELLADPQTLTGLELEIL